QLDALREQAYARRAPVLLTGVYEPGALLDEDTASLEKLVPAGCGLEGVHAEYERVTVTGQRGAFLDISALTTMPASVLFCNGTAKAQASGSGPIELHLVLVRSGARYLIHAITK
ncbi:MAG: hypothetical protein M3O28_02935, partial [Actinomycetota bacterium]|nr:hypothetical protein [Actinomycetota bacterium]